MTEPACFNHLPKVLVAEIFNNFTLVENAKIATVCQLFNEMAKYNIRRFRLMEKYAMQWLGKSQIGKHHIPKSKREFIGYYNDNTLQACVLLYVSGKIPTSPKVKRQMVRCKDINELVNVIKSAGDNYVSTEDRYPEQALLLQSPSYRQLVQLDKKRVVLQIQLNIPRIYDVVTDIEIFGINHGTVELQFNGNICMKRKVSKYGKTTMFDEFTQLPIIAMAYCQVYVVFRNIIIYDDNPFTITDRIIKEFIDKNVRVFVRGIMSPLPIRDEIARDTHVIPFIDENVNIARHHRTQKINYLTVTDGLCSPLYVFA